MTEAFAPYASELVVRVDANLLLDVDMKKYDNIFVCGPLGMMEAAARMAEGLETKLYVSLEKRMACGIEPATAAPCERQAATARSAQTDRYFRHRR